MWMTSCTGSAREGFWEFWKKSVSWVPGSEEEGWLSLASRGLVSGAHVVWDRWKNQYRKMVSLYLCRKTFKLKGNKTFRTWTKKSWVFFVFQDSYVLCDICYHTCALWTFYVHFPYPYLGYVIVWRLSSLTLTWQPEGKLNSNLLNSD